MSILRQLLRAMGIGPSKPPDTGMPHDSAPKGTSTTVEVPKKVSKECEDILNAIKNRESVILVHGRAGTGKTTLIREVVKEGRIRQAIVAPTGVAAINAGGQTIHSFFGIPPRIINLDDINPTSRLSQIVRSLDVLIIDEISMVRADTLDVIDRKLRLNRTSNAPFGGLPILMVGDFLQLPPVVPEEEKVILEHKGYMNFYALNAKVFSEVKPYPIELENVHRQNELEFIEILRKVRIGEDIPTVVETLNRWCYGPHKRSHEPVILAARTAAADTYNEEGLRKLAHPVFVYEADVQGEFRPDRYPASERLELKKEARIMMVKNDSERRWVNGSLGTIAKLTKNAIWVRIDGKNSEFEVHRATWENTKYEFSIEKQRVEQKVVGRFSQFPIKHAWALTIHKSQGLTLQDVRVDLEAGAFTHGQTYVALSRATTLDGLSFSAPLRIEDIKVDHDLMSSVKKLMAY